MCTLIGKTYVKCLPLTSRSGIIEREREGMDGREITGLLKKEKGDAGQAQNNRCPLQ